MRSKATHVVSDSHLPDEAAKDTPLYAFFENGEWYYVDEDIWADLVLQGDEYAFTCETCQKPLSECECGS